MLKGLLKMSGWVICLCVYGPKRYTKLNLSARFQLLISLLFAMVIVLGCIATIESFSAMILIFLAFIIGCIIWAVIVRKKYPLEELYPEMKHPNTVNNEKFENIETKEETIIKEIQECAIESHPGTFALYCPHCGKEKIDGANFCPYCGKKYIRQKKNKDTKNILQKKIITIVLLFLLVFFLFMFLHAKATKPVYDTKSIFPFDMSYDEEVQRLEDAGEYYDAIQLAIAKEEAIKETLFEYSYLNDADPFGLSNENNIIGKNIDELLQDYPEGEYYSVVESKSSKAYTFNDEFDYLGISATLTLYTDPNDYITEVAYGFRDNGRDGVKERHDNMELLKQIKDTLTTYYDVDPTYKCMTDDGWEYLTKEEFENLLFSNDFKTLYTITWGSEIGTANFIITNIYDERSNEWSVSFTK